MIIRKATREDVPEIAKVFEASVREIGSSFYGPEQVEAWAARHDRLAAMLPDLIEERFAWVAEHADGRILAYLDLEKDGHVDFYYALPEVTRTQLTTLMFDELEATAQREGMARLFTEASEAARRFAEKRGFKVLRRQDFEIDGVLIHNFAMEKVY